MSELKTPRPHRRRGAAAVSALSMAVLVLAGIAIPTHADERRAPTSPASAGAQLHPDPAWQPLATTAKDAPAVSPEEPESMKQGTNTVDRKAVEVTATGYGLKYAFAPGMYPSNPQLTYDGSPGAGATAIPHDWTEGGTRYLQWNYGMPKEGMHSVVFSAKLNDTGKVTDYSVKYTSKVDRTGGSIAVVTDCAILYKGKAIDLDSQSPYTCQGGTAQGSSGLIVAATEVGLRSWANISGNIQVSNVDDTAPKISLTNGVFGTTNQYHRIIMNGSSWFPFDDEGVALAAPQYATISNGENLTWSTSALNLPRKQSEVSSHAQAYFIYEVFLGGESSGYWVKGSGDNYKWNSWWYPTAKCEIYAGDPNNGGVPITHAMPFTCEPSEFEIGTKKFITSGPLDYLGTALFPNQMLGTVDKSFAKTDFVIQMDSVDTIHTETEAKDRGVVEACGTTNGDCFVTPGQKTRLPETISVPHPDRGSTVLTNDAGTEGELEFDFSFSREVKNTLEQMFGVTTKAKVEGSFLGNKAETSIEFTSETSFGFDISNGFEVSQKATETVPYWSTASFSYTDVYDRYDTDVYFFGESDVWYRATGATITVPVPSQVPTVSDTGGPIVEPAQAGDDIPGLSYKCTWMENRVEKILGEVITEYDTSHQILPKDRKVSAYAEVLNKCNVPESWNRLKESSFTGPESHLKWQVLQMHLGKPDAEATSEH